MSSSLAFALPAADTPADRANKQGLKSTIVDPVHRPGWDTLLNQFADATSFHTAAWARVLAKSYGHKPCYLSFSRGEEIVGLLPLMEVRSRFTGCRGVSLPFSDFCGPLVSDESIAELIAERLDELSSERRWDYVEVRGGGPAAYAEADREISFYGHRLSLAGTLDELWNGLTSPVRRAIRKAEKSNIEVEVSTSPQAVREFYQLHRRTRRRHGLPPQPFRFFQNISDEIIEREGGFVALAKVGSRPIAAAMFFELNGNAVYKFGASDESQQDLRANNLVMWEAIKALSRRGCHTLHFGRTELGNEGLRRFKEGWGAIEEIIQYFKFHRAKRPATPAGKSHAAFYHGFFRRMPLPMNTLAGALIYPHLD